MGQQGQASQPEGEGQKCRKPQELLDDVNAQIGAYAAKKLAELKTELEAFLKKEAQLADDYKKAYPKLKELWCAQHQSIQSLYASMKCAFPENEWKELVCKCICARRHD